MAVAWLQMLRLRLPRAGMQAKHLQTDSPTLCRSIHGIGWRCVGQLTRSTAAQHATGTACGHSRPRVTPALSQEHREPTIAATAGQQLPSVAYGQVVSSEANFVRVDILHFDAGSPADGSQPESDQLDSRRASHAQASTSNSSSNSAGSSSRGGGGSSSHSLPPHSQLLCTVRALLKKLNQRVLVGDKVRVHGIDWISGQGVVDSFEPRSSELADPAVANVDHVLLLFGLTQPPFEPVQVSRFLISIGASGLPITLALNKCDLLPESEVTLRVQQVASWGCEAIAISCQTGQGLDRLATRLAGATTVVAGPSGAGKSSLINTLRLGRHKPDAELQLPSTVASEFSQQRQQQHRQQQRSPPWEHQDGGLRQHGLSDDSSAGQATTSSSSRGSDGAAADDTSTYSGQSSLSLSAVGGHAQAGAGCSSSAVAGCDHCSDQYAAGATSSSKNGREQQEQQLLQQQQQQQEPSASNLSFLAVGDVSKIGRGKHTTRAVTLIELPFGGFMADSPGFNQPTLDRVSSTELAGLFPEFATAMEQQGGCRFADCMHLAEPGCAVTQADLERYEHYVKFLAEIKAREEYDVRVMQLAKQRREGAMKVVTGRGGVARYEARLDSKRHRTTSRKRIKQALWDDK